MHFRGKRILLFSGLLFLFLLLPAGIVKANVTSAKISGSEAFVTGTASYSAAAAPTEVFLVTVNQETGEIEYMVDSQPAPAAGQPISFTIPLEGGSYHYVCEATKATGGFPMETKVPLHLPVTRVAFATQEESGLLHTFGTSMFMCDADKTGNPGGFIAGRSKKGIQGDTGAEELNVGHVFLNLYASQIWGGASPYEYNGTTYGFDTNVMNAIVTRADQLRAQGIAVTLQIMLDYGDNAIGPGKFATELMVHTKARKNGHFLYSWENKVQTGREMTEAMFSYIAEACMMGGEPRITQIILGNEVNCHTVYQYKGTMSTDEFYTSYAETYRILNNSVRSLNPDARVYICLDHGWTKNPYGFTGKSFLKEFNWKLKGMDPAMHWDLAYHPYSQPLSKTKYWECKKATNSINTKYITMKNIRVLTTWLAKNHPETKLILSEIGYTSGSGSDAEQELQAKALKKTYKAVVGNERIDAIMIRAYADDPNDGILKLGLKFEDGREKKAWNLWKSL